MSLSPIHVYALLGLGAAVAVWQVIFVMRRSINVAAFGQAMAKLISAGELERAIKLCNVVPHVPLARLLAEGLEAARQEEDAETRARRLEQAYEHRADAAFAPYGRAKVLALVGIGLCVAGALLALAAHIELPPPYVAAGAGTLLCVHVLRQSATLRRRCDAVLVQLAAAMRNAGG